MVHLIARPISAEKRRLWYALTGVDSLPIKPHLTAETLKYTIDTARLSPFQRNALAAHVARTNGITRSEALRALLLPSIAVESVIVSAESVAAEQAPLLVDGAGHGWAIAY